jgi:hypothetical protein
MQLHDAPWQFDLRIVGSSECAIYIMNFDIDSGKNAKGIGVRARGASSFLPYGVCQKEEKSIASMRCPRDSASDSECSSAGLPCASGGMLVDVITIFPKLRWAAGIHRGYMASL